MTEFFIEHWGDLSSAAGVIISFVGLTWAIAAAQGARSAAQASQEAADETRNAIGRHLLAIDLERSINLIQRLTLLHSSGRWEASLEQYQALRAMISSIIARYPGDGSEFCGRLSEARTSITMMESRVESRRGRGMEADVITELNDQLRSVQRDLEEMSSTMELG